VFTARYASPYIKQIRFVFKGLKVIQDVLFWILKRLGKDRYVTETWTLENI
jgi:hypothetical protein